MPLELATWLVRAVAVYAALGLLFAVPFALVGARRIDPDAAEGTWGFRLLILPGAAAFWPYLLLRWRSGEHAPRAERNAHRDAAQRAGGRP